MYSSNKQQVSYDESKPSAVLGVVDFDRLCSSLMRSSGQGRYHGHEDYDFFIKKSMRDEVLSKAIREITPRDVLQHVLNEMQETLQQHLLSFPRRLKALLRTELRLLSVSLDSDTGRSLRDAIYIFLCSTPKHEKCTEQRKNFEQSLESYVGSMNTMVQRNRLRKAVKEIVFSHRQALTCSAEFVGNADFMYFKKIKNKDDDDDKCICFAWTITQAIKKIPRVVVRYMLHVAKRIEVLHKLKKSKHTAINLSKAVNKNELHAELHKCYKRLPKCFRIVRFCFLSRRTRYSIEDITHSPLNSHYRLRTHITRTQSQIPRWKLKPAMVYLTPHYLATAVLRRDCTWKFKLPENITTPAGFFEGRLGFSNVKSLRRDFLSKGDSIVSGIRTDGYDMSLYTVRACSEKHQTRSFNVENLPKRGLKLKEADDDFSILSLYRDKRGRSSMRGIYDISDPHLKRFDVKNLASELRNVDLQITGLDFGLAKPFVKASGNIQEILKNVEDTMVCNDSLSFQKLHLSNSFCDSLSHFYETKLQIYLTTLINIQESEEADRKFLYSSNDCNRLQFETMSKIDVVRGSKSYERIHFENTRLDLNKKYAQVISDAAKFSKNTAGSRSASASQFRKWLRFQRTSREIRSKELMCGARRKHRWNDKKNTQRFYSLAAEALCGRLPHRDDKHRSINLLCFGDFSGNGTCSWSGIRRHKRHLSYKRLLRECASRAPVFVMDEYGTSFSCPGCSGDMITTDNVNRIRTCQGHISNGKCCLNLSDRDENSAVQMILGAVCRLVHGERPPHLRRPTQAATATSPSSSSSSSS